MIDVKLIEFNQNKMLYVGFTGAAFAFFLALLGSAANLTNSNMLHISTIFFACALALYAGFTISYFLIEIKEKPEEYLDLFRSNIPWIDKITFVAHICGFLGVLFLIGHFSILAFMVFLIASSGVLYLLIDKFIPLVIDRSKKIEQEEIISKLPVRQ